MAAITPAMIARATGRADANRRGGTEAKSQHEGKRQ
jgi:hypothetical protein